MSTERSAKTLLLHVCHELDSHECYMRTILCCDSAIDRDGSEEILLTWCKDGILKDEKAQTKESYSCIIRYSLVFATSPLRCLGKHFFSVLQAF